MQFLPEYKIFAIRGAGELPPRCEGRWGDGGKLIWPTAQLSSAVRVREGEMCAAQNTREQQNALLKESRWVPLSPCPPDNLREILFPARRCWSSCSWTPRSGCWGRFSSSSWRPVTRRNTSAASGRFREASWMICGSNQEFTTSRSGKALPGGESCSSSRRSTPRWRPGWPPALVRTSGVFPTLLSTSSGKVSLVTLKVHYVSVLLLEPDYETMLMLIYVEKMLLFNVGIALWVAGMWMELCNSIKQ